MATPFELRHLSVLALVASDAAYKSKADYDGDRLVEGLAHLESFPDSSSSANEQGIPASLLVGLPNDVTDLTVYGIGSRDGVRDGGAADTVAFFNWSMIKKFQTDVDGFGAAVFRSFVPNSQGKHEFIVAFQGSDGTDPKDWFANLDLAREVWEDNGPGVVNFLVNGDIGDDRADYRDAGMRPSDGVVHFTGQSLGGALAQYGAYFYARAMEGTSGFDKRSDMSLIDFNGFGAVAGIDDLLKSGFAGASQGTRYDPTVMAGVPTLHYAIQNDIVHRLGTGNPADLAALGGSWHVNGLGNSYEYDFRRFENGAIASGRNRLGIVDAHRVESGFYRGFANYLTDFADSTLIENKPYAYIDTHLIQNVGTLLSRVFSDGTTTDASATARLAVGLIGGASLGPISDYEDLKKEIVSALYESGSIDEAAKIALNVAGSAVAVKAVINRALSLVAKPLGAFGWLFTIGMELFKTLSAAEKQSAVQEMNSLLPADRHIAYHALDDQVSESERALQYKMASLYAMQYAEPADIQELLKTPEQQRLIGDFVNSDTEPRAFGEALTSGEHWVRSTLEYIGQAIASSSRLSTKDKQFAIQSFALELSRGAMLVAGTDQALVDRVRGDLNAFLRGDLAVAIAKANPDVVTNETASISIEATPTFPLVRELANGFLDALKEFGEKAITLLSASGDAGAAEIEQLRGYVQSAAQQVVLRPRREANPFDDAGFDPTTSLLLTGGLEEGSLSTFTAYLPYEAGAGGQRIAFDLGGVAAEELSVLANGEEIELDADGTFTLTVGEGQREITFSVAALADLDADETLTLSAQLVNAAGEATHLEHEELALSLDARDEAAPSGGLEYRGDWNVKYYRRMNGYGTPAVDDSGQPIYETRLDTRYPHFENVERSQDAPPADLPAFYVISGTFYSAPLGPTMSSFRGHEGTDSVQMGRYNGADVARTLGGDDAVAGSALAPNIIYAGAGSDWVEGQGFATQGGEQSQFTYQGRVVTLGDDQIHGGAGDDALYGESAGTQDLLNDSLQAGTGLPGDWLNGGTGDDRLHGSAGDDVLLGGTGEDLMQGGAGKDVLLGDENFGLSVSGNYWRVMHTSFGDSTFSGFEVGLFPIYNYSPLLGGNPGDIDPNIQDPYVTYYKQGGDDVLIGGAGEDILIGQAGDDTLYGGDDDDILAGWEGGDQIVGGDGNDMLAGDFGRYEQPSQRMLPAANVGIAGLVGSSSFDASQVDQVGNDYLDGGAGNDTIFGEGGDDVLMGREGTDTLFGDANYLPDEIHGADLLDGGAGSDLLYGNAGNDRLFGGADNDLIDAGAGHDHAEGGTGSDSIFGGEGGDTLHGGTGNDELDGGGGGDALYGESGADSLEGGAGADNLHGGSGEDILSGGVGDDRLDGGVGVDVLRGGEGDDTYVIALGYGQDIIEDAQGRNRLSFGAGVTAEGMSASVDSATLDATITFSGIGDTVAFNAGEVDVAGVDFAGAASWGRKEFLGFLPAILKQGSEDNETLAGHESLRNDLRGESGDDTVYGSANDDMLSGGEGADALDGRHGSDRYVHEADEPGIDLLADSGISARAYLEWFYAARGVQDWEERGLYGGRYRAESGGEGGSFREYFDSYEEAVDQYPFATITQVEPLLDVAPLVARDDETTLDLLAAAGVLDRDVVQFGAGLTLEHLALTLRVNAAEAAGYPGEPARAGGTLSVRWNAGAAGFDLAVPDTAYGFPGQDLFADGEENSGDSDAWRGYRLGEGIEEFRFADDSAYSLQEMLARASIVEIVEPLRVGRDQGALTIGPSYEAVVFEDAIRSFEIGISREGLDLLLAGPGTLVRIAGWFADPARMPATRLEFELDSPLAPHALTEAALVVSGTEADEVLQGLDGFDDTLNGFSGNDTLHGLGGDDVMDGGDGDDLLVGGEGDDSLTGGPGVDRLMLERGGGRDRYGWSFENEAPASEDRIRAAADVLPEQVFSTRGLSGLSVWIEGTEDGIEIPNWFDDETARLGGMEFADGTFWDADAMEARLEPALGTEGDDAIFGTTGDDAIDALAGADFIYGDDGDDVLAGGAADDEIDPGEGYDIARGGDGDDSLDGGGEANDLLDGGLGDDYIYLEGHALAIGGAGDDWIDNFGPGAVVAFNSGDGHDTVYAHDSLTLSLGSGIPPSALSLSEDGDGLLLSAGASDSIRLTRAFEPDPRAWPEITLQLFGSVHTFDFSGIIADFHAALVADPSLATFPLAGLLEGHRTGFSETDALGGALAWQYATTGSTAGLTDDEVRSVLRDPAFGFEAQSISLGNGNRAPTVANALTDGGIAEDSAFRYVVAPDAFADPDPGDVLTYAATLADGTALPGWLAFDAASATFTGTPENGDVGTFEIRVTASDQAGLSAADTFSITVDNANDAPTLANPIADQSASVGEPFSFTFAADAFADIDRDDELSYTATLAEGNTLPDWLVFDGAARSFTGTPTAAESLLIRVTTVDGAGASAADEFALEVAGTAGETIIGTPAHDTLVGTPGDDLLDGRRGNDALAGGLGDDVYLHELHGGHDVVKDTGGNDTLLFGAGITARMVRLERRRHDLVVDLAGPHGSITIKDWFSSASRRIERFQFADGTTWDAKTIRERSGAGHGHRDLPRHEGGPHHHHHHGSRRDEERRRDRHDESRRDHVAERVGELLGRAPRFDFDELIESLQAHPPSLPAKEIAQRWAAVRRYAETIEGQESDGDGRGLSLDGLLRAGSIGWGFEGSTGASRAQEEFKALEGLKEGFRRL